MTYASEVLADNPVLWWRLGESSGASTVVDSSAGGRSGTYLGSPILGAAGLQASDSDTSMQKNAGAGYAARLAAAGGILSATSNASIECWFKTTAASGFVFQAFSSGNSELSMQIASGSILYRVRAAATTTVSGNPSAGGPNGNIYHAVITFASGSFVVYINGVSAGTGSTTGTTITLTDVGVGATNVGGSNLGNGTLDEFAIYNTALSAGRVSAHYAAANTPPITIHPNKITSTGTVHAPAIVPYIPPPADGNINITAELTPATKYAACIEPDRSAQIEPARHVAGVNAT